jgi:hypothetical protein
MGFTSEVQISRKSTTVKNAEIKCNEPWPTLLPDCDCHRSGENRGRVIKFEGRVFCGNCGVAYGEAGSVGVVLTYREVTNSEV